MSLVIQTLLNISLVKKHSKKAHVDVLYRQTFQTKCVYIIKMYIIESLTPLFPAAFFMPYLLYKNFGMGDIKPLVR